MSGMLVDGDSDYISEYNLSLSVNDVFEAEKEILNGIADEGSCVIAGRSGFFVLNGRPNKVDILITASREKRIVLNMDYITEDQAVAMILSYLGK